MTPAQPSILAASGSHSPPPAPPRAITAAASARSWHEPRVHFWWIVALALLAAAAYLAIQQFSEWNAEAQLFRGGTRVDAVIWRSALRVKGQPIEPGVPVELVFDWNGQQTRATLQRFTGRERDTFQGETISIRVDPKDPQRFTVRSELPPLVKLLMGAISLAVVAALLLAVGFLKRRSVLTTWRAGEAHQASVVEIEQTALAPRSRLVRCALTGGRDRRLINVYVPRRVGDFQPGETIWLVMPPGRPDKALAAASFSS